MKKPISPRLHGVLDYTTVATLAAAPRMMNFPERATRAADTLAGSYGGLSAFTDYPLAVRRKIPFKAHGAAELASGLALPLLPWLLGFSEHKAARNFFLGLTALTFVVAALTDWDAEE
jgi:hypothetical protein